MELRQLAYFVAVAEERQFTRAAERVAVAQPAVSAQIRRLERELGEPLFYRDKLVPPAWPLPASPSCRTLEPPWPPSKTAVTRSPRCGAYCAAVCVSACRHQS